MSYSDPAQHKAVKASTFMGFLFPGALESCRHCHGIQIWVSGQTQDQTVFQVIRIWRTLITTSLGPTVPDRHDSSSSGLLV
jgi:hypothetical protein